MKFGQFIEYIKRNIFFKNHPEMRLGDKFQTSFCFLKSFTSGKSKWSAGWFD